jgi:hypothetical protein
MKNLILTIAMFLFFIGAYSQQTDSTIVVKQKQFYQNDKQITKSELSKLLANNPASSTEYKKWMNNMYIGLGLELGGGALLLTATIKDLSATMKQNKDLNNGTFNEYPGASGGLYLGAVVCSLAGLSFILYSNKHMRKSIELYNSSFSEAMKRPVKFEMMVKSNELGVRMTF